MSYDNPDEDRVPTRQILAAWQDGGLVWVVSSIPGPRWREGLTQAADELHGSFFRPTDLGLIFDSAVQVYDARSGKLFAARYSEDLPVAKPIGPGIAARMTTDEFGWVYLHVQRARLSHPNSP